MKFTAGQAAKAVGKSMPTISKALKTGRLSAEKVGNKYEIDASELFRVWPKASDSEGLPSDVGKPSPLSSVNPNKGAEINALQDALNAERKLNSEKDGRIADLTQRAERAEQKEDAAQAQLVGLLTDQRTTLRKGFWQRLKG
jgi:excisionase family DNA binding protein